MTGCWKLSIMAWVLAGGMVAEVARAADVGRSSAGDSVRQVTLFREGQGPYNNYRIPAVVRTKGGAILAFCEGRQTPLGPGNDTGEINLVLRRSTDGGRTFRPLQVVWADGGNTCGNPCPVVDEETGVVWLLMTHNLGGDHEKEITAGTAAGTRTVWVTSSEDEGVTWARPREITGEVKRAGWTWYATGPGIGVQVRHGEHAGRLVVPCDYVGREGGRNVGNSHVIYSDDHGKTWRIGGEAPERRFNESQVVELSGGRLMLNMRNWGGKKREGWSHERGVCVSEDGGVTFGGLRQDPALLEPGCQGSILRYSWAGEGGEGRSRILFANPASATDRVHMTVRVSYDEGETWPVAKRVFEGWSAYSSLVALPGGRVGLLYEAGDGHRYERIDFATFDMGWLTNGADR